MFMPKLSCIWVSLKRLLRTTSGITPCLRSMQMRISFEDSSRISEMPSIFFSRMSSCIFSYMMRLLTMYGISVMMIR